LGEAKPIKVHVVYFDTMVHKHVEMDPGEIEFEAQPQGGGGTSFCDLFDWAEREGINPAVAIVLTDMMGSMPTEAPPYPVVWASTEKDYTGPFGDTIYIS
jgi:predicted metal-dependent peptidase